MSGRIILVLLFFAVFNNCSTQKTKQFQHPNFIFIYTDDQRHDAVGFIGNKTIITPEIDKFAQNALQFENANVVFSLCSPSRAALLTGRYGSANGVLHLNSDLKETEKTIASLLKEAGYRTAISGKWHLGRKPDKAGFDFHTYFKGNGTYYGRTIFDNGEKINPEIHCDEYCVNRSIDFLRDTKKENRPFFLFHNTQLPHMNGQLIWDAKQSTLDKYEQTAMPVAQSRLDNLEDKPEYLKTVRNNVKAKDYGYPDSIAIQKHTKAYYAVITEMDDALGRLFKAIDELGLRENTYIFFMSDNGWMLGDHGFTSKVLPYQPSSAVPAFIMGPGIDKRSDQNLVLNIDMAPTILDLAEIKIPGNMHGRSLKGVLSGKNEDIREAAVYEGLGNYGGAKPNLTVISKEYRYIETYEDETLSRVIFRELYHQENDVDEMNNLVNNAACREIVTDLKAYIEEHKKSILGLE